MHTSGAMLYHIHHFKTMKNPYHKISVDTTLKNLTHFTEIHTFRSDLFDLPRSRHYVCFIHYRIIYTHEYFLPIYSRNCCKLHEKNNNYEADHHTFCYMTTLANVTRAVTFKTN